MPDRTTSLGRLSVLTDRLLFNIFIHLQPGELLHITPRVSWVFYQFSNLEELWRRLVLLDHIDEEWKLATFCFKGSWKLSYWRPEREVVLVPLITTDGSNNGHPTQPQNSGQGPRGGGSGLPPTPMSMTVVAVEDWKLQNRKLINKLSTPSNLRVAPTSGTVKAIPAPKMLSEVITYEQLPGSYSINHAHGLRLPPPYAMLRPRDTYLHYNVIGSNLMQWPMNLTVDRRDRLTLEEFQQQYELPNRPVVLTGVTDHWPARWKWQPDMFAKYYKDTPMKCNGRSTDGRRFRMKGFDFMSYCTSYNGEKSLYVFDKKVFHQSAGGHQLEKDFEILPYFRDDLFELMDEDDRPDYRWLLVGPNGCGSPFHQDPHGTSAWNAVMCGVKRVSFYPPEVIPPGVDEELIDSDYYASDDMMDWYRNTYPTLAPERRPMECLVFPGEVVYIPSMWWHSVMNIGTTIAITQNTASTNNFFRVAAEINATGGKHIRKDFKDALSESPKHQHLAEHIALKKPKKKESA